jgi:hypothetical protein
MTHAQAKRQFLEAVFPESHPMGTRIFWDAREGQYYDSATDLILWGYDPTIAGRTKAWAPKNKS